MSVHVSRNFFGSQIASFEQLLPAHDDLLKFGDGSTYRAVFIRAPAILRVDKDTVTVLSEYTLTPEEQQRAGRDSVIVAAKSENMLVTAFHPELTEDARWCVLRACWFMPNAHTKLCYCMGRSRMGVGFPALATRHVQISVSP